MGSLSGVVLGYKACEACPEKVLAGDGVAVYICSGEVGFSEERRDKRCCVITACSFCWQFRAC